MFDYASRRARTCTHMRQEGMEALLLFRSSHLLYLTGWTESPGERVLGALITPEREAMIVPRLYAEEVAAHAGVTDLRIWEEQASWMSAAGSGAIDRISLAAMCWARPRRRCSRPTAPCGRRTRPPGQRSTRASPWARWTTPRGRSSPGQALADLPRDLVVLPV